LDLRFEGAGDAHRRLERHGAGTGRAQLQDHPAPVLACLRDVGDHSGSLTLSPPPADALAKPRARSANDFTLSSTSRLMVPAAKRPSGPRSPAFTPVRISMPSSMLEIG